MKRVFLLLAFVAALMKLLKKYMFKVNNRSTRRKCEICSKLTIKIPERRHCRRSGIFIVNFEHFTPSSTVSIVNFEQVNAGWDCIKLYR